MRKILPLPVPLKALFNPRWHFHSTKPVLSAGIRQNILLIHNSLKTPANLNLKEGDLETVELTRLSGTRKVTDTINEIGIGVNL
jgi:hypothetical protein